MSKFVFLGFIYIFLFLILSTIRADLKASRKTTRAPADIRSGLEILSGEDALEGSRGSYIPLSSLITFGRDPSNSIQIFDSTVSNYHSKISLHSNDHFIEDLGSKNGTFINDERIDHQVALKKGDIIRIGMISLKFLGEK